MGVYISMQINPWENANDDTINVNHLIITISWLLTLASESLLYLIFTDYI